MEIALDQKQTQHWIGLSVSLIGLALFVFFGKGVVLYGSLMGMGMFATILLVSLRAPRVLKWANNHPAATEILTTGGTFVLFSFFGGGTVTAGIASAVVCLLVSAVLGCSKLGFLDRLIGKATDSVVDVQEYFQDKVAPDDPPEPRTKHRRYKSGRSILQAALARAVVKGTQ